MDNLYNKLEVGTKFFWNTKYKPIIEEANVLYKAGKDIQCERVLDTLPTKEHLLSNLLETLKEKSVYKSLVEANQGKPSLKAITSLCTHIAIEIEKGNLEYKYLLPNVMEKINEEIWKVLNG